MNGTSSSAPKPVPVSEIPGLFLISVLTPTIHERHEFLRDCRATYAGQVGWTGSCQHIIEYDKDHEGCAVTMNRAAKKAKGDWFLPLADDDMLLPRCLETLRPHTETDADVIYAPPLVNGNEDRWWFFQAPPAIPSFGLIRRTLWEQLGGYDESLEHEEDRDFWTRALETGAKFVRVDEPLWVYRQHTGNKSFNKAVAT